MSWDELHKQDRFLPRYPEPAVVRWVSSIAKNKGRHALDIGFGSGRHATVMADYGFLVTGVESSETAFIAAGQRDDDALCHIYRRSMLHLPFSANQFDAAVSWGAFYYGTWEDMQQAVKEMHRVLKPGGHALVNLRTTEDSRNPRGYQTEPVTLTLEGDQPESGMTMTFVPEGSLYPLFQAFSSMTFERSTVTRLERTWRDDDWVCYLVK